MFKLNRMISLEFLWFFCIVMQGVLVQPQQLKYNKELSKDVTTLLDGLLKEDKYDKRFRPNFGGLKKSCKFSLSLIAVIDLTNPLLNSTDLFFTLLFCHATIYVCLRVILYRLRCKM
jgi:hypothetical protein